MADISGNGVNIADPTQCVLRNVLYIIARTVSNVSYMLKESFLKNENTRRLWHVRDLESFIAPLFVWSSCLVSIFRYSWVYDSRVIYVIYVYHVSTHLYSLNRRWL